jgi:tetratricopeptide (TPR) repeat protein
VLRARRLYERAAELAGTHASVDLLLELGAVLLATGAGERAIQTFRRVKELPKTDPGERIAAQRMLGRALYSTGHLAEASAALQAATEMALHSEPAQAIEALLEQVFMAYFNGGPARAAPFAERARELAVGQPPALRMRADTAWAFCAFVRGDIRGIPVIEDAARTAFAQPLADTADYAWSWGTLGSYANMAKWSERFGDACNAYEVAMQTAERSGSPVAIAQLAVIHGDTCLRMGKLADALKLADRASSLSELAPETAFWAAICHGYGLAEIGRMEECRSCCDQAASQVLPDQGWVGYVWLWHLQAVLAMHARDTVAACQLFGRIEAQADRLEIREHACSRGGTMRSAPICTVGSWRTPHGLSKASRRLLKHSPARFRESLWLPPGPRLLRRMGIRPRRLVF